MHFTGQSMKKTIKEISSTPPSGLRVGGGKSTTKTESFKDTCLFNDLTLKELTEEEKKKLKLKGKGLLKRLRSKNPKEKRQNELLLRQIIAYLSLEFGKVTYIGLQGFC